MGLSDCVVDAWIEAELPGAIAWARRHSISLTSLFPEKRLLRVTFVQEPSHERFFLQGRFDQYKSLPPVWDWRDETWKETGAPSFGPRPQSTPFGSSIFLSHGSKIIICAPFNRLAFSEHGGPHSDWGGPAQWITAGSDYVQATTIGDMLHAIARDFHYTTDRMG